MASLPEKDALAAVVFRRLFRRSFFGCYNIDLSLLTHAGTLSDSLPVDILVSSKDSLPFTPPLVRSLI